MKTIALKTSVAALSFAMAFMPVSFAQTTPVSSTKTVAVDTKPLPGAKKASVELLATLGVTTATAVTALVVLGVVVTAAVVNANQNDDNDAALRAAIAAAGTTGTR